MLLRRFAPAVVFVVVTAVVMTGIRLQRLDRGDFRIDEAHKISETVFFRLLLEGRTSDELWTAHPVDRANPPVGKYAFGASILLHGLELPAGAPLSSTSGTILMPPIHPVHLSAPYRGQLPAARQVSAWATALTAALLAAWLAARHAYLAATVAVVLYMTNFLTRTFAATAVFDPLLSLLCVLAVLSADVSRHRSLPVCYLFCFASGVFAALAFQTRVTGVAALFAIAIATILRRDQTLRVKGAMMATQIVTFGAVAVLVNPFYWGGRGRASLPATVFTRVTQQYQDLEMLNALVLERGGGFSSPGEKLRFVSEIIFGDLSGLALFGCLGAAVVLLVVRRFRAPAEVQFLLTASALLVVTMLTLLTVAWPRHLLVLMPHLCMIAGVAAAELTTAARTRLTITK